MRYAHVFCCALLHSVPMPCAHLAVAITGVLLRLLAHHPHADFGIFWSTGIYWNLFCELFDLKEMPSLDLTLLWTHL